MSEYQPTYVPSSGRDKRGSPLSPPPPGQPQSFTPNVNRQKTKRWVNAKSYSYDGDEWGESDDESADESQPPLPALPNQAAGVPQNTQESQGKPGSAPAEGHASEGDSAKPLPFIRPADIYRRMEEEKQRQNEKDSPSHPAHDTTGSSQPDAIAPGQSENSQKPHTPPESKRLSAIKPVSGFGEGLPSSSGSQEKGSGEESKQKQEPQSTAEDTGLHHNPSLGFRSVVHQAFDAPPGTPSTTTGSIRRSDSASTSIISPIIQPNTSTFGEGRGASTDQTPTIEEEPADFKPGHRRSLTPPRSGSSPARRPVVLSNVHHAKSHLGDLSEDESTPDTPKPAIAQPLAAESGPVVPEKDTKPPAPSSTDKSPNIPSSSSPESPAEVPPPAPPKDSSPAVPPALNVGTDKRHSQVFYVPPVPDTVSPTSPENTSPNVHERLKDEIMQSLSPRGSAEPEDRVQSATDPGPSSEPRSKIRHESTLIPSEYDSYWNDEGAASPDKSLQKESDAAQSNLTQDPAPENTANPKLKKRFSWEESSIEDNEESQRLSTHPAIPGDSAHSMGDKTPTGPERSEESRTLGPSPTIKATSEIHGATITSPMDYQEPFFPPPSDLSVRPASRESPRPISQPKPQIPPTQDPKLPGFREIMAMKTTDEKVKTFEQTRQKFAGMDTGLSSWIQETTKSHPDHAELVQRNGLLPAGANLSQKPISSRNKFPKLPSLGNLTLQTSHLDGSASSPGHTRHASGNQLTPQQMQARGKDFLHSAGVLGGKAGGAAKGLFAKGRSKFRNNSGSTDKVKSQPVSKKPIPGSTASLETQQQQSQPQSQYDSANTSQEQLPQKTELPRLPTLKLDRAPFYNGISTTWEEQSMPSPISPETENVASNISQIPDKVQSAGPTPVPPTGNASQKSSPKIAVDETGVRVSAPSKDSVQENDKDVKADVAAEAGHPTPTPSTPRQVQEEQNEKAQEAQQSSSVVTDEKRPFSTAESLLVDKRASVMTADSNSIAAPVEEALAIKVISRKASVIHSESRNFSSRKMDLGNHENSSTIHLPEPTLPEERKESPTKRETANGNSDTLYAEAASSARPGLDSDIGDSQPNNHFLNGSLSQPQQDVSPPAKQQSDETDAVSTPKLASTEPHNNTYLNGTVHNVSAKTDSKSAGAKVSPPNMSKALPALPPEANEHVDEPKDREPVKATMQKNENHSIDQSEPKANNVAADSDENVKVNGKATPPATSSNPTSQHPSAQDQPGFSTPNNNSIVQASTPPQNSQTPSTSQPQKSEKSSYPLYGDVQHQPIREFYAPGSNTSEPHLPEQPSPAQERSRPSSGMAGLISKVPFARQAERRANSAGQSGEKNRSSRLQAFKADNNPAKSRGATALEAAPEKRSASPMAYPSSSAAGRMRIHVKFVRSATRLAHNADEMRKKNMPKVTGLFNRQSKAGEPPFVPQNPGYTPQQYETDITALPQPSSYPQMYASKYSTAMPPTYQQQQQTPQAQTINNPGRRTSRFYQSISSTTQAAAFVGSTQSVPQLNGSRSMTSQSMYAAPGGPPRRSSQPTVFPSQAISPEHTRSLVNPQPYPNNLSRRSQSVMSFVPFHNGRATASTARVSDQGPPNGMTPSRQLDPIQPIKPLDMDPAQYPLPDSTVISPASSPQPDNIPPPPPPKIPLDAAENGSPAVPANAPATDPNPPSQASPTPTPATNGSSTPNGVVQSPPAPQPSQYSQPSQPVQTVQPQEPSQPEPPLAGSVKQTEPVELPVPIPGDDSSEEIVMSSTSYPGQEWQPDYYFD
ncbi:hypothetical protein AJ79_06704 [Helicocarpus griseus UAMH5409]|uniref:Uncharacterized protein n=1 Tax=Helicocarpus griseus UAMH5409 TaxID=1447875 RepID=A0A2B7XAV9_9EURO|nr:hypothetical protein AJ79_06704 [Helicocarpus griseus UAMH5409]